MTRTRTTQPERLAQRAAQRFDTSLARCTEARQQTEQALASGDPASGDPARVEQALAAHQSAFDRANAALQAEFAALGAAARQKRRQA